MRILIFLPDIQDIPTGGNIFNNNIVDMLRQHVDVTTMVIGAEIPACVEDLSGYDLVIVDSLLAGIPGIATLQQATSIHAKWILLVHYLAVCDPTKEEQSDVAPEYVKRYDAFVTTSQFSKDCLIRLGVTPKNIHVAYPGLSVAYHKGQNTSGQAHGMRMLTVSSLLPGKGLLEFVDVLHSVSALDWTWNLIGDDTLDPDYAAAFKSRIKNTAIARQIRWLGVMPPAQMPAHYTAYDLFVLPSRFETLGMAIREAMASGLPVVAFDVGGISESLAAGGGVLIPAYDNVRMSAAIESLAADVKTRNALGKEARALGKFFPSWEASAIQLIHWFQSSVL
ncbi:MAG: glycosyltransferase family 4 protein [Rhodothermales bacterium]